MPFLTLSNNPEKRRRQVEFGQAVDRETERVQNVQDLISAIQTLRAQENTVVRRKPEKPPVDYFDSQQIDRQQAKQLRELERDIAAANRKGAARPDGTLMGSMRTLGDAFSKDEEAKLMAKVGLGAAGLVGGLAAPLLVPSAPVTSAAAINAITGLPINLALGSPEGIGQDAVAGAVMGRAASAIHPLAAIPAALASYGATSIGDAEAGGFLRRLVDLPGPAVTARRYTPDERTSMLNELAPYARPRVLTPKASNILTSVLDDAVKQNETTVLYDRFNKPVSMYSMAGRGEPFDDSSYLSGLVSLNGPAGTGRQAAQHAARNSSLEGFRLFSTPTSQGFWDRIVESEPDWIKQYMPEHELEAYRYLPPINFAGGGLASMAKNMARRAMSAIDEVGGHSTAPAGALSVVKNKGGNWLNGSVEDALKGLKKFPQPYSPEEWAKAEEILRKSAAGEIPGADAAASTRNLNDFLGKRALDSFIDKQLTRYVKNEMATPEDPIRALAERGVLHFEPGAVAEARRTVHPSGEALQTLGQSPLAKAWEQTSDRFIAPETAGRFKVTIGQDGTTTLSRNPWLEKLPNDATVYDLYESSRPSQLGFDHLTDELSNALNPESGLPRHLLLDPKSMDRVSVPQAVERVSQINAWRAAQKAEADAKRANNAATVLHKEYPDKGFKWVELKASEVPNPEMEIKRVQGKNGEYWTVGPPGKQYPHTTFTEDEAIRASNRQALADALKYEGDTMGHCVGGYCDDVASGRSRIYSLRDAKGQPHVTIEVGRADPRAIEREMRRVDPQLADDWEERLMSDKSFSSTGHTNQLLEFLEDYDYPELDKFIHAQSIKQIKGKQNRTPNEEYLPFVQDFVRSGQWSDVGDLQNTGLVDISRYPKRVEKFGTRYITETELNEYLDSFPPNMVSPPEGFAHGGSVELNNAMRGPVQTKPFSISDLQAIISQLRMEHSNA